MTHHHVNIKRNFNTASNDSSSSKVIPTRHTMTQPDKYLCKTVTHHNKQFKSLEQLFKRTVHDSSSKHCSGQLICNYSRILFKKDNNSRAVQSSLLFSTVSCFTFDMTPVQVQHKAAIIQDCRSKLSTQDSIFIVRLYAFNSVLYSINRYSIALYLSLIHIWRCRRRG